MYQDAGANDLNSRESDRSVGKHVRRTDRAGTLLSFRTEVLNPVLVETVVHLLVALEEGCETWVSCWAMITLQ